MYHNNNTRLCPEVIGHIVHASDVLCMDAFEACEVRVSAHSFRDPGKSAWAENFLELMSVIITELSLFG